MDDTLVCTLRDGTRVYTVDDNRIDFVRPNGQLASFLTFPSGNEREVPRIDLENITSSIHSGGQHGEMGSERESLASNPDHIEGDTYTKGMLPGGVEIRINDRTSKWERV